MKKSVLSQEPEMQTCGEKCGKNYTSWLKRGILVELAHVKAHHTKKEKEKMAKIERFATEGHEKVDELAKAGAMLDEGFMASSKKGLDPSRCMSTTEELLSGFGWRERSKKLH